jgi:hypothetical protein
MCLATQFHLDEKAAFRRTDFASRLNLGAHASGPTEVERDFALSYPLYIAGRGAKRFGACWGQRHFSEKRVFRQSEMPTRVSGTSQGVCSPLERIRQHYTIELTGVVLDPSLPVAA